MNARPQFVGTLIATLALFMVGSGFADEPMGSYAEPTTESMSTVPDAANPPVAAEESSADASALPSNSQPVAARDDSMALQPVAAPVETAPNTENLNVYGQRRTEDEFITDDVVNALRNDSRIHGKIGVDTFRRVVTLTGRVSTPGQVERISYLARGVVDRDVEIHNNVRSMVNS